MPTWMLCARTPVPDTLIRNLDPDTQQRLRTGAAALGMTQAEYLRRLMLLPALAAEHPRWSADRLLSAVGLATVTV